LVKGWRVLFPHLIGRVKPEKRSPKAFYTWGDAPFQCYDENMRNMPFGKTGPADGRNVLRPGWFAGGLLLTIAVLFLLPVLGCARVQPPESEPLSGSKPSARPDGKEVTAQKDKPDSPPLLRRGRGPGQAPDKRPKDYWVKVRRVIDGVTLALDNQHVVRLIGLAPPMASTGRAYRDFFDQVTTPAVRSIIEGKRVRLMRDKVTEGRDGRGLVYLFLEDRTLLNASLVQKGYARMSSEVPFKFQDEFKLWERQAQEIGLGLWSKVRK
jgi:endonuclease YncB( thermonuclease family)